MRTSVVVPKAVALPARSVPLVTVSLPVRVLLPLSTQVAAPSLTRSPLPAIVPLMVLSAPVKLPPNVSVSVGAAASKLTGPVSDSAPVPSLLIVAAVVPAVIVQVRLVAAPAPV